MERVHMRGPGRDEGAARSVLREDGRRAGRRARDGSLALLVARPRDVELAADMLLEAGSQLVDPVVELARAQSARELRGGCMEIVDRVAEQLVEELEVAAVGLI